MILRNARVLLGHVNDLLDTSKIEASKLELDYAELDLGHLVRLVANNFETLALDRSVTFVVRAPDEAVPAQVDPTRVQQVLLNLLSNAFKFTPARRHHPDRAAGRHGRRHGAASRWPTAARASSRTQRGEVFERFHQLDGSSTRKMGGTGLGLHIARELVDLHGGSLGVGDAPEGGALFVMELPVAAPPGTRRAARRPWSRWSARRPSSWTGTTSCRTVPARRRPGRTPSPTTRRPSSSSSRTTPT